LHAIADLYERHPNRLFSLTYDDDTFALSNNLHHTLTEINPDKIRASRKQYPAPPFVEPFAQTIEVLFNHGQSGQLITRALMKIIAPHLEKCAEVFGLAWIGSDISLTNCIS
jgi:hypothetical protein